MVGLAVCEVRQVFDGWCGVGGYADWSVEPCEVFILRSAFPNCIAHESLHCFNKAWHGNRPSAEWCMIK